jgi:hypothetical protein
VAKDFLAEVMTLGRELVVDRIRGSGLEGSSLLRNADTGHYTQFFGRIGFDFFIRASKLVTFVKICTVY